MIGFAYQMMSKAQVDGVKELIDLCRNGYIATFSSRTMSVSVFGLRHCKNGRKLTMIVGEFFFELKENGKILKSQYYDDKGVRIVR